MASWKSEKKEKNWDFILAKRDNKSNKNFIKPLFLVLDDYRSTVKFQWCHRHSEKMSIQAFCFFFCGAKKDSLLYTWNDIKVWQRVSISCDFSLLWSLKDNKDIWRYLLLYHKSKTINSLNDDINSFFVMKAISPCHETT
jgi:hypothetical protein